jgi:hypothetical protein
MILAFAAGFCHYPSLRYPYLHPDAIPIASMAMMATPAGVPKSHHRERVTGFSPPSAEKEEQTKGNDPLRQCAIGDRLLKAFA